jgi:hypothetical protein
VTAQSPHRSVTVVCWHSGWRAVVRMADGNRDPAFDLPPKRSSVFRAVEDGKKIQKKTGLPMSGLLLWSVTNNARPAVAETRLSRATQRTAK